MKKSIFVFLGILCLAGTAAAQSLNIDSMSVSSNGTELTLYGDFGASQGVVTLEGIPLVIEKWSSDSIKSALQQPAYGKVIVHLGAQSGAERILENIILIPSGVWFITSPYNEFYAKYQGDWQDSLWFAFDGSSASNGKIIAHPYEHRGHWSFNATCSFDNSDAAPSCGDYSASGQGTDSATGVLSINRGVANLTSLRDSANYSFEATHCVWDSSRNDRHITSTQSGIGLLTLPASTFQFAFVNTAVLNLQMSTESGNAQDSTFNYFFGWAQPDYHSAAMSYWTCPDFIDTVSREC